MTDSSLLTRAGLWRCECSYLNVDAAPCARCGRKQDGTCAAAAAPPGPSPIHRADEWAPQWSASDHGPRFVTTKAVAAVAAVLVFNVGVQTYVLAQIRNGHVSITAGITLELLGGLMLYVLSGALVFGGLEGIGVKPVLVRGTRLEAAAAGALRGGLVAAIIVALGSAAGHGDVEPTTALLSARDAYGLLIVATVLIVVAAPLVEELVFRGVLAESLRRYGTGTALVISSAAFAVAHLHPGVAVPNVGLYLLYYFFAGRMLGRVYFRRGLFGSVAAHAMFNGTLVLATVLALHGGAHTVAANGVSATVPSGWHSVTVPGEDLALVGPQANTLEVAHRDYVGPAPEADMFSALLVDANNRPRSAVSVDPGTVHHILLPAGDAVEAHGTAAGHSIRLVVVPKGNRAWIVVMQSVDQEGEDDTTSVLNSIQFSSSF